MPDDDRAPGRRRSSRPRRLIPRFSPGRHLAGPAPVPAVLLRDGSARRYADLAKPGAVILAGVLLVVAFMIVVSRAGRDGEPVARVTPAAPQAVQPAPPAPSAQALIPLPSATPSPSPSLSPPPSSPPPVRSTAPAATDEVGIVRAGVPATVNLSGEGTRDWVHWGGRGTFSLERAAGGEFRILEGAPSAPRRRHELSAQRFAWTGGSPVARSRGTASGIRTCGKDNGFQLSVPAARTERTLRLYVGALAARGRLDARLSTGGPTRSAGLEQRGTTLDTAVFVISYRSARDARLQLDWVTEEAFTGDCGGVALQAATLS